MNDWKIQAVVIHTRLLSIFFLAISNLSSANFLIYHLGRNALLGDNHWQLLKSPLAAGSILLEGSSMSSNVTHTVNKYLVLEHIV